METQAFSFLECSFRLAFVAEMAFRGDHSDSSDLDGGGCAAFPLASYSSDDETMPESIVLETPCPQHFQSGRPPLFARDQADAILGLRAEAAAVQHNARMRNGNVVHGSLASMYPHLERYFDGADGDCLARIDWNKCEPIDLWHVLTSKHLSAGKMASMAFSFRECLKKLKEVTSDSDLKSRIEVALKDASDKNLPNQSGFKKDFIEALAEESILAVIRNHMAKYHASKKIKIKDGLFPKFTDVQTNKVRIACWMVSASTQALLHASQNPSQARSALDNAETRIIASRTKNYEDFTSVVNSDDCPDVCVVDMTAFNGITVDCTSLLGDPMTMLDVTTVMRDLKKDLSKLMSNFTASGEGVNGSDMFDRDCEFYDRFCKGDAVLFAVYLAWDHGRNIPQWNSTLLPKDLQLDIGTAATTTRASTLPPPKKPRGGDDIVAPNDLAKLVEMQTKFFDYALGGRDMGMNESATGRDGPNTQSSASSSSTRVSDSDVISQLQRLRADTLLSSDQRKKVDDAYNAIIDKVCLSVSDLTS